MTNLIVRCGCDLVRIERFEKHYSRSGARLLERIFSQEEIQLTSGKVATMAGFYAAKEAFAKALGTGLWAANALRFTDMSIKKTDLGAPFIIWQERIDKLVPHLSFPVNNPTEMISGFSLENASLSISHDGDYAIAYVVITLRREELEDETLETQ